MWFLYAVRSKANIQDYRFYSFGLRMCSVSPAEIEFLAEDELIKITPRFSLEKREFISGDYGPFTPGVPTKVPVWMAINLKVCVPAIDNCNIKLLDIINIVIIIIII